MTSTLREIRRIFISSTSHPRFWAMFACILALFSLVGPFGTFERLTLFARIAYWTTTMLGSWLIAIVCISIVAGVLMRFAMNTFVEILLGCFIASPLIALNNLTVLRWAFPEVAGTFGFLQMLAYTLPITLLFGTITWLVMREDFQPKSKHDDRQNLLMNRLPIEKRGVVKHMAMQDHYVAVTTTRGSELILMRMADAVEALAGREGLQVHRSYWVNKKYIAKSRRDNGQVVLEMDDGKEFPVSRSFAKAVKEAGLV